MSVSFLKANRRYVRYVRYVRYMRLCPVRTALTGPKASADANALTGTFNGPCSRVSRWFHRYLLPACCVLLLAALPASARAHPHVWINYSMVAQTQGTLLVAVQETWTFSKGFPFSMVGDFSSMPKSGPLNASYTATFKAQAFSSLKGADYFTHVFADGKAAALGEPRDFSVGIEDGHVVYRFLMPLVKPVDVKRARVTLGVWDDTFFVDFENAAQPMLTLSTGKPGTCRTEPFEDHDHPIFGGTLFPQASRLLC
ncbi:DUF1007 family protein [Caballeronia sp. SEWSISQ10-4 2]|uniref:DUF1007 family protein n=1 Tax=Caballeronia sp. SEWSISQ10-4 2 TaxID=2937438 RepID=UPI002656F5AF|nr:DUF1007 family protein [Caballeronia sp. SEWSISQ10-4 2]MDN7184099.1 DUF1007 family protein [Caballeronia sp. SEWSISQ10-4 2]